jgi:hypothetical protein
MGIERLDLLGVPALVRDMVHIVKLLLLELDTKELKTT